jgi:hypothetical protein
MYSAKALVLPIFRRYRLWNAWEVSGTRAATRAAAASTTSTSLQAGTHFETRTWRDGHTLEERFALVGDQLLSKFQRQLSAEWNKLESARDVTGTLHTYYDYFVCKKVTHIRLYCKYCSVAIECDR